MKERLPIRGRGRILETLPHDLYRVRMPNGYEPQAHLDRILKKGGAVFESGQEVELEFSAWDMSQPRIVGL